MTWRVRWDELPLARGSVDRAAHLRARPDLLTELMAREGTRVVLARGARVAVRQTRTELYLRIPSDPVVTALAEHAQAMFLGTDDDGAYLALVHPAEPRPAADPEPGTEPDLGVIPGAQWQRLREVGHLLGPRDAGLAATAVALGAWHASHRFCARCGAPTEPSFAGWQRRCTAEGTELYPRTDPAVIMAVVDPADRILLAHATHWPERRFSTLAGFVEAGESAEQALRREVLEEVALPVTDLEYRGSQTWPFPASLMLAFQARTERTDVVVDGVEIEEARWFDRAGLEAAARSGEVILPGRASVARALVEEWFGGPLP